MINVLIVDDERLARVRLAGLLAELQAEGFAGGIRQRDADGAATALALLAQEPADLLLLDIRMPVTDGLALAERLRSLSPSPAVIFVTAQPQHALQAFDLDAVDYLTKPVTRVRLKQALEKALRRMEAARASSPSQAEFLVATERGRAERVQLADLLYLRAEQKYVTLRTSRGAYLTEQSLAELETQLGPGFVRIHRNALVARGAIKAMERRAAQDDGSEGWAVQIGETGEWLTVSRRQAAEVRELLFGATGA